MLNRKIILIICASIGALVLLVAFYKLRTPETVLPPTVVSKIPDNSQDDFSQNYIGSFTISMKSNQSNIDIDNKTDRSKVFWEIDLHFGSRYKKKDWGIGCNGSTDGVSFIMDNKIKSHAALPFKSRNSETIDFGINDVRNLAIITDYEKCSFTFRIV